MPLRTVLIWTQRVALVISATAMIFVMFGLGHTETFSTRFTITMVVISGVGAITLAALHWAGLPKDTSEKKQAGRRARNR